METTICNGVWRCQPAKFLNVLGQPNFSSGLKDPKLWQIDSSVHAIRK